MRNYLLYALGLLLWMGGLGCGPDEAVAPVMEEGRTARVSLSLGMEPMTGTTTRALAPHIPEVENLINDVWVLQFNSRGQRLTLPKPYDDRGGAAGLYIDNYQVDLVAATNSTVCLVVNTGDLAISWPDNLPGFQRMLLDIEASNDLSQRDRIPMCGYWVGDVTDGMSLSVMLCRMMTRINLVLNNATGVGLNDLTVELVRRSPISLSPRRRRRRPGTGKRKRRRRSRTLPTAARCRSITTWRPIYARTGRTPPP